MEWTETLNALLEERGWSAADLSRAAKVSEPAISRYLNGERKPDFKRLVAIADALDVPLLGGTPTKPQRDPEVEEFVREWTGLPDEERAFAWELVRILGKRPGKKSRQRVKPIAEIRHVEAVYEQRG